MRTIPRAMPALITPFNRTGSVDEKAHKANVSSMWDRGMRGFLLAGSTGEGQYLEAGERRTLSAIAREAAPRSFILCGVQAETLRSAQGAIREATEGGADAVLVITPTTLVRRRADLIEDYFADVATDASLPVLLYSVPQVTALELAEETVARLATHDRVVGMKDSGGDPLRAGRLAAIDDAFALFTGSTAAISLAVTSGAYGAITASANYAARLVRDTVIAARRSVNTARSLQMSLTAAATAIERYGIPGVKYAASRTGLASGQMRRPLQPVGPEARTVIRRSLRDAGLV